MEGAYFDRSKTKQFQPKIKIKMKEQFFLKPGKYASDFLAGWEVTDII